MANRTAVLGFIPDNVPLNAFSGYGAGANILGCEDGTVGDLSAVGSGSLDRGPSLMGALGALARRGAPRLSRLSGLSGLGDDDVKCPSGSCVDDAVTLFLDWPPKTVSRRITSGQAVDQYNSSGLGPSQAVRGIWIPRGLRAVVLWIAYGASDKTGWVRVDMLYGPGLYDLRPPKGPLVGFVGEGVLERLKVDWEAGRLENLPAVGERLFVSGEVNYTPPAPPYIANIVIAGKPDPEPKMPTALPSVVTEVAKAASGQWTESPDQVRTSEQAKCTLRRGILKGREKIKGCREREKEMGSQLDKLAAGQQRIIRILNPFIARMGGQPFTPPGDAVGGQRMPRESAGSAGTSAGAGDNNAKFDALTKRLSSGINKKFTTATGNTKKRFASTSQSLRTIALKLRDHIADEKVHVNEAQQQLLRLLALKSLDSGSPSAASAASKIASAAKTGSSSIANVLKTLLLKAKGGGGSVEASRVMQEAPTPDTDTNTFFKRISPILSARTIF